MLHLQNNLSDSYASGTYWQWGRANKLTDILYEKRQIKQLCKDYLVDTFYRNNIRQIVKEQENSNCFFIYIPDALEKNFLNNINIFLHLYEETHGYIKTSVRKVTKKVKIYDGIKPYIIEGDIQWMMNTFTISHYLSLLRLCGHHTNITLTSSGTSVLRCNETSYISSIATNTYAYKTFQYIWQHPHFLDMVAPEGHHPYCLYKNTFEKAHGMGGYFFILSHLIKSDTYSISCYKSFIANNPMVKKINNLYEKIKNNEPL